MYYDSNVIAQSVLTCTFCPSRFVDLVRLVPDCGNSICEECHQDLKDELDADNKFHCRACGQSHVMPPQSGLAFNNALMTMLQFKPVEKALPENAKKLREDLEDVKSRVQRLHVIDEAEEINTHCDMLVQEISEAVESGVKHLSKIGDEFIKQVNEYRTRLLNGANKSKQPKTLALVLDQLSEQVVNFSSKWTKHLSVISQVVTDRQIEEANERVRDFEKRLVDLEVELKDCIFKERILRFRCNLDFSKSSESLGFLEHDITARISPHLVDPQIQAKLVWTSHGHPNWAYQSVFLPDERIASSSGNDIVIRDKFTGRVDHTLKGHVGHIHTLTPLPNDRLASGSADKAVKVWDLRSQSMQKTWLNQAGVFGLQVLKDGNLASCSWDNTIRVVNPACNPFGPFAFSREVSPRMTGHLCEGFVIPPGMLPTGNLVTCSADDHDLCDCIIRVWDPKHGKKINNVDTRHKGARALLVLSDGRVAIGFKDGAIIPFDLDDSLPAIKTPSMIHPGGVGSLVQLPNGHLLSGGLGVYPQIKVWNPKTAKLIQTIQTGHRDAIRHMSISQDGKKLATSSIDRTVKVWSLTY